MLNFVIDKQGIHWCAEDFPKVPKRPLIQFVLLLSLADYVVAVPVRWLVSLTLACFTIYKQDHSCLVQLCVPRRFSLLPKFLSAKSLIFIPSRMFGLLIATWLNMVCTKLKSFLFYAI